MKFVKFLPALATVIIALPTYAKAAPTVTDLIPFFQLI